MFSKRYILRAEIEERSIFLYVDILKQCINMKFKLHDVELMSEVDKCHNFTKRFNNHFVLVTGSKYLKM